MPLITAMPSQLENSTTTPTKLINLSKQNINRQVSNNVNHNQSQHIIRLNGISSPNQLNNNDLKINTNGNHSSIYSNNKNTNNSSNNTLNNHSNDYINSSTNSANTNTASTNTSITNNLNNNNNNLIRMLSSLSVNNNNNNNNSLPSFNSNSYINGFSSNNNANPININNNNNNQNQHSNKNNLGMNQPRYSVNIPSSSKISIFNIKGNSNNNNNNTNSSSNTGSNMNGAINNNNTNINNNGNLNLNSINVNGITNQNRNSLAILKTKRSGSISTLLPLRESITSNNFSNALQTTNQTNNNNNNFTAINSSITLLQNGNNVSQNGGSVIITNNNNSLIRSKSRNIQIAQSKRHKSNSLSIIDYCNIINMNTNFQMLADFYEDTEESMARLSLKTTKNGNIQKQASLSEQMAALFGSSMCACELCKIKSTDCKKQFNFEIIPNKHNGDYSIIKYTYSTPYSQLSTLKLFNLMNTDCSIYFSNEVQTSFKSNESNSINGSHSNFLPNITPNSTNITVGANSTATLQNFIHINSNSPPIFDPRYMYLIDCRLNRKKFEKNRINTAIHYSDLLNDTVYLSPAIDNFTLFVLYDEDGTFLTSSTANSQPVASTPLTHATLNSSLSNFSSRSQPIFNLSSTSNNETDHTKLKGGDEIISAIKSKLNCNPSKTFYILSGGYEQFSTKFPFMCSNVEVRSTVDRNKYLTIYPNCVIENQIYIGSGIQAKNWKIIRDLRITHIINCSIEHECVFKDEIKYLHVKIEDSYQENIYKIFDNAIQFINDALIEYYDKIQKSETNSNSTNDLKNNIRITSANSDRTNVSQQSKQLQPPVFLIHCNLGISRSSSILIAYLISKYKLCLYAAFKYVKDKRLQIAPNYSFLRQLKQFEESFE